MTAAQVVGEAIRGAAEAREVDGLQVPRTWGERTPEPVALAGAQDAGGGHPCRDLVPRPDLLAAALRGLGEVPVVALLGARQAGKTTLARQATAAWAGPTAFFDLEAPTDRQALFELLRPLCDEPSRKAVYLLTGSASWDLIRGVSETLAGRVQFLQVGGFALAEVGPANLEQLWVRGGFPRAYLAGSTGAWARWMRSFAQTLLERDIPGLGSRVPPVTLGRFWRMLAHLHGQTWNAAELARPMGTTAKTATGYRDLLAGTFMVRLLQPWFENVGKRLVKSPKLYIRDSGILHHLLGLETMRDLASHPRYGASWEGFAIKQVLAAHGEHEAYFYGTQRGAELDLMLLRRGRRWGFEFKCADAPRTTRSMHMVSDDLGLERLLGRLSRRPRISPRRQDHGTAADPCRGTPAGTAKRVTALSLTAFQARAWPPVQPTTRRASPPLPWLAASRFPSAC